MKLSVLLVSSLLLCACAKPQTVAATPAAPPPPQPAGQEWCDKVYGQILNIEAGDPTFQGVDRKELLRELDRHFHRTGAAQRFLASCLATMTEGQAQCAFRAQSLEQVQVCTLTGKNQ